MHLTIPTTGVSRPKPVRRQTTNERGAGSRQAHNSITADSTPAEPADRTTPRSRQTPRSHPKEGLIRFGLGRALGGPTRAAALIVLALSCVGCGSDAHDRPGDGVSAESASREAAPTEADDPDPSADNRDSNAGNRDPADASDAAGDWKPNATVERVVDGNTLIAEIGGRSESVRLIGIDTPESVARSRPVECYGLEASQRMQELLPPGTAVTLVRDVEGRDAYDRLLGYVVRSDDGLFINLELVASGYAATLNFPPNDHYADALARAQSEAVAARRGLWGVCGSPDVPVA